MDIKNVDWHIITAECGCTLETISVADAPGERTNLDLRLQKMGGTCGWCRKVSGVTYVEGEMASKRLPVIR